jgi:hypothetical protein
MSLFILGLISIVSGLLGTLNMSWIFRGKYLLVAWIIGSKLLELLIELE